MKLLRGNREGELAPNSEEQEPNRIRLTAGSAADVKKVLMVEANVNALKSLGS